MNQKITQKSVKNIHAENAYRIINSLKMEDSVFKKMI